MGRRTTDPDLAVVIERLTTLDEGQERILSQVTQTNGRVSELEIKERIRQDREEQAAIRSAAAEAAKYRVEQANEQKAEHVAERAAVRFTWKVMLLAAAVGSAPTAIALLLHL